MVEVSVIIPSYKDDERLNKCIRAIDNQTYPKDNFEVIIVNNAPSQDIEITVSHSLNLSIFLEKTPGSYAARNLGAANAKGDILAFTDSDCIPESSWLMNAVEMFSDGTISLLGGKIQVYKEKKGQTAAFIYEKKLAFNQKENVKRGISVTANLFMRNSVFHSLSGFREGISGGDAELTRKATSNGYNLVFGEEVVVRHPARKKVKEILTKEIRVSAGLYSRAEKEGRQFRALGKSILLIPLSLFFVSKKIENIKEALIVFPITFLKSIVRVLVYILMPFQLISTDTLRNL